VYIGEIFCDLAIGFDSANHEIVLTKLYFYDIDGIAAKLFRSCPTDRKQKVKTKSSNNSKTCNFQSTLAFCNIDK
jgi:hypothetical protein